MTRLTLEIQDLSRRSPLTSIDGPADRALRCGGVRSAHLLDAREAPQREVARQNKEAANTAAVRP